MNFDKIEIFWRKKDGTVKSEVREIKEIRNLDKEVKEDIKKITLKRKSISGLKFDTPQIMGVLNITPDSFSDGGFFLKKKKLTTKLI